MFLLDNKPLPIDTAFTHDGIQYPSNWLRFASAEDKAAIGITEVAEEPRADDRFYWNGDINLPKQLDDEEVTPEDGQPYVQRGLKSQWVSQVKQTAGTLLAQTDWMVIRKAERDVAIPESVAQQRLAIIAEADRLEAAITEAQSVEALIEVVNSQGWPTE